MLEIEARSDVDPSYTGKCSLFLVNEGSDDDKDDDFIPGFEIIFLISCVLCTANLKQRKRFD